MAGGRGAAYTLRSCRLGARNRRASGRRARALAGDSKVYCEVNVAGMKGNSRVLSESKCKRGEGDNDNERLREQNMVQAAPSSERRKT